MAARVSLRSKWTGVLLLCLAVPLGLFAYTTMGIQRRGLETAERHLEIAINDHVAALLDQALREAAETTHRVGRLLTEASVTSAEARLELARDVLAGAEVLAEVAVYGPDGALLDAIQRTPAAPAPPERLPAAILSSTGGQGAWLPSDYAPGAALLRYAEPVVARGQRRAFVLGTVAAAVLNRRLEGLSRDRFYDRPDGVLLLDREQRILAGGATGALAVGQGLAGRDVLTGLRLPPDAFSRPFAAAAEFRAETGEPMVGSVRSIPAHSWAVVVRCPVGQVYGALASSQRLLGSAALVCAALAGLLGTWLAARTTRPIQQLRQLARAFGRREFDTPSAVHTGDELEELAGSLTEMAQQLKHGEREIQRRAAVEMNLSRYVPRELASAIALGQASLSLGGQRRQVSVLFADVVSFTSFAERAPAERVVAFLNELFTVLTEVVFRHQGTIDKFIGDCIMVIFGAPQEQPDHAHRALQAAEDIHRFVETNAPAWKQRYDVDVRLSIGIATGEALVGNLGSELRMDYTVIGDVVNTAARIQGLARPGQTLLTAETARAAGDAGDLVPLGEHPLRGKRQTVQLFGTDNQGEQGHGTR